MDEPKSEQLRPLKRDVGNYLEGRRQSRLDLAIQGLQHRLKETTGSLQKP